MKPRLRDYATILVALLTIFLCGYGVGFLTGEKKGRTEAPARPPIGISNETGDWETRTMERLTRLLDLSEEQTAKVENEVKSTSQKIQSSRDQAVDDYYRFLLDLHDQLLPHLDPAQQEKIKKDRKSLQQAIELRFKSSAAK
ncbi:MAG: molecular chaperone GrpE (heat shock protein) [Akkermansiaceae bacterium]|jgi:molecular chaperone GrpE (heat shock protein)